MLAPSTAPAAGKVFEAWAIGTYGPVAAGTGRTFVIHVVEDLSASSAVSVTIESAPGANRPTGSVIAQITLV